MRVIICRSFCGRLDAEPCRGRSSAASHQVFQSLASIRLQRARIAAGLCAATLLLAACGSKGALYVPPPDQPRPDNATRR
jgi:hypothetical protein